MNRFFMPGAAAKPLGSPQPGRPAASTLLLMASMAASTGAMADRTVTDLQPSELGAFVQQHPQVVVQFTSPDKGCGYCIGADKLFTDGVAQSGKEGWKYVRVQWPRWNQMPTFAAPVKVWGVPDHQVYEGGAYKGSAGGRGKDAAALMASIANVGVRPNAAAAGAAASAPKPAEMTPEIRTGLRFYALRKVLGGAVHDCERQHHGNKSVYAPQLHAWIDSHAVELKLGTRAMFATMGAKQHPYKDEMAQQSALVSDKLTKDVGIVEGQPATLAQCEELVASLGKF